MQTLWSRANRPITSSCRCKWCLSTPASALRQSIVGLPHGRFQLKHLTTTLFYSSLIATAAAIDVRVKNKRREQWDRAIAAAERALHTTAPSIGETVGKAETIEDETEAENLKEEVQDGDYEGRLLEKAKEEVSNQQSKYDALDQYFENTSRETEHLHGLVSEVLNSLDPNRAPYFNPVTLSDTWPRSIYAGSQSRDKTQGEETWVPKKRLRLELVIAQLAARLLYHVTPKDQLATDGLNRKALRKTLDEIRAKLQILTNRSAFDIADVGRLQYPQYRNTSSPFIMKERDKLNASIDKLSLKLVNKQEPVGVLVTKIAYNLLVSPVPPDNTTYTMLLSRFSQANEGLLADQVAKALFTSHQRPDEMVIHSVLQHCRRHGQARNFGMVVSKLQGLRSGLMLAHPCTNAEGFLAPRLRRAGPKTYQSIPLDRYLFNMMTRGFLKFGNLPKSTEMFRWMRSEGIEPDLTTYSHYLHYFARHGDWERGLGVWKRIKATLSEGEPPDLSLPCPAHHAYRLMLRLCKKCNKEKDYQDIIQDAYEHGYTSRSRSLANRKNNTPGHLTPLRRAVRVLERRMELLERDIHRLGLQLLATKIVLSGSPLSEVRHMFLRHADEPAYQNWVAERQYFKRREWSHEILVFVAPEQTARLNASEAAQCSKVDRENERVPIVPVVEALQSAEETSQGEATKREVRSEINSSTELVLNESNEDELDDSPLASTPRAYSPKRPSSISSEQKSAVPEPVEIQAAQKRTAGWIPSLYYDSYGNRTEEPRRRMAGISYG